MAHSSVLISCGDTKLIMDPWLKGPAYNEQWFLWPLPVDKPEDLEVDAILITHGHEDHLHPETLRAMKKDAHVFFSYQWRAGIKSFLNQIGFSEITEAVSFRTYEVKDVKITYIGFSLESVVVVEYENEVLVNINDALNSNHENAVEFILKELKLRWPKITYLLSGWSGASYFPNQVRYPGKNDEETGRLREQYFANNFCRFVHRLQPNYALPFASGFVLLYEENKWINHVKFLRTKTEEYYKAHYDTETTIQFPVLYPGDELKEGRSLRISPLHQVDESRQMDLAYKQYAMELKKANEVSIIGDAQVGQLLALLRYWVNFNRQIYHVRVTEDLSFSIRLRDCERLNYINLGFYNKQLLVQRANAPLESRSVLIHTSAARMLLGLKKVWGGDLLTIGYGITVEVYDQLTLEKNLDIVCIRLVTRYPIARQDLMKFPIRALKFYAYNPKLTSLWIKQKIVLKPYVNKYPYNERDHWMNYNKCDLCAVCKMPEIDLAAYS